LNLCRQLPVPFRPVRSGSQEVMDETLMGRPDLGTNRYKKGKAKIEIQLFDFQSGIGNA